MALRFAHVSIACQDMATIETFYSKHFGFKRARLIPLGDDQILFIKNDTVYLELFNAKGERPAPPAKEDGPWYPGVRHIAFQVDDVDAQIASMGDDATITLGPLSFDDFIPGWRTVWVSDPEGNIIEISQGYVDEASPPAAPARSS
jgi:glyoxylase I family protein